MLSVIASLISGNKPGAEDRRMGGNGKAAGYRNTLMEPSSIHPIHSGSTNILTVDHTILDISPTIDKIAKLPKLQVVQKDGQWFTLNNAQLHLWQLLQQQGKSPKVSVNIVPLSSVPRVLRSMMVIPHVPEDKDKVQSPPATQDQSRTTNKGYQKLHQLDHEDGQGADFTDDSDAGAGDGADDDSEDGSDDGSEYDTEDDSGDADDDDNQQSDTDGDDEETNSDISDLVENDSECDWSDEGGTSQVETTSSDDEQSKDDEHESLL